MLSFCHGAQGFSDKTTEEQLNSFIASLQDEFQEPPDSNCRRLAAELSAMKEDPSETVDEFAFKYKSTIHQLDKLGESLTKSCPTYVTSQFISKLQPHLTQHLILQAHQMTQLDKAVEAAHRIEHSLIAAASTRSSLPLTSDSPSPSTVFNGVPQPTTLFSSSRQFVSKNKQSSCWICGNNLRKAHECPQRSAAPKKTSPEVCSNFNTFLSATCEQSNNKCSAGSFTNALNVKNGLVKLFVIRNSECSP